MSSFLIHVLNVGHGDSIVLELPDNMWGVVDCSKTAGQAEPPALTLLRRKNVQRLKFICLTHPHWDHFHGMLDIIKHFTSDGRNVEQFWDFGLDKDKFTVFKRSFGSEREFTELQRLYDFVLARVLKKKIQYLEAKQNTVCFRLSNLEIFSLAPLGRDTIRYVKSWGSDKAIDENLLSVVLVIIYGQARAVLGSDTKSWEDILKLWRKDCGSSHRKKRAFDFVKVSHHGSRYGNHEGLWNSFTVKQQSVAVISAGCQYDCPHPQTVKSIVSHGVGLYSTNFWDLTKPIPKDSRVEDQLKPSVSDSVLEALDALTLPVASFERIAPYHGDCTTTIADQDGCIVVPQCNRPAIS